VGGRAAYVVWNFSCEEKRIGFRRTKATKVCRFDQNLKIWDDTSRICNQPYTLTSFEFACIDCTVSEEILRGLVLTEKWGGELHRAGPLSSWRIGLLSAGKIKTLTYLIENHVNEQPRWLVQTLFPFQLYWSPCRTRTSAATQFRVVRVQKSVQVELIGYLLISWKNNHRRHLRTHVSPRW